MKRTVTFIVLALACLEAAYAQIASGTCGEGVNWSYDGQTLFINKAPNYPNSVSMEDYDLTKKVAPWIKKRLNVRQVEISDVNNIGSCAFANCKTLQVVIFKDNNMKSIGWGAFFNCTQLRTISLPLDLNEIGKIAFANCESLTAIELSGKCHVGDKAFASCRNIQSLFVAQQVRLGRLVFATEVWTDNKLTGHKMYNGEIRNLPLFINEQICEEYGLSKEAVAKCRDRGHSNDDKQVNYDLVTSEVDESAPVSDIRRQNTYVLIIGNQNYRSAANVPYAIHDARVFSDYCKITLGVPSGNIHLAEDATKQMILEEELEDWLGNIHNRQDKHFILYYAGHGVPDTKHGNKSYLLPTDVRGTSPQRGIALDDLYARLGRLQFQQTTVFLDACFSGVSREGEGVVEGTRGTALAVKPVDPMGEGIVVFSATQGNETAQAYDEQGHGLFTYCLLKELQTNGDEMTYGELSTRLKRRMQLTIEESKSQNKAKKLGNQTVTTTTSDAISGQWRDMSF